MASKTIPLECMKDAKSAIRHLRENAQKLKIDPNRIVAAGGSAGGQLAASLCMINTEETTHPDDNSPYSSIPNAAILYNPYYKCVEALSPPSHVTKNSPPMITFSGGEDSAIPVDSLIAFQNELKAAGNTSITYIGHEGKHGLCNGRNPQNPFFYWGLEHADKFLIEQGILTGSPNVEIPKGVAKLEKGSDYTIYK